MPSTVYIDDLPTGQSLTVDVFPENSDTAAAAGVVLSEATNRKTLYSYSNAALTGLHRLAVKLGSSVIGTAWAVLATSGTVWASTFKPGVSVTTDQLSAAALAQLTEVGVRLFSRQPNPGLIEVIQFDEWTANNQLLRFLDEAGTSWPELPPGTAVKLRIEVSGIRIQVDAVLVNGEGVNKEITVAVPRAESGKLPEGDGLYQLLRAPGTSDEWLLDAGTVAVTKKIAAP